MDSAIIRMDVRTPATNRKKRIKVTKEVKIMTNIREGRLTGMLGAMNTPSIILRALVKSSNRVMRILEER